MVKQFILLVLCVLISLQSYAFRCNNKLITEGMDKHTVLSICGNPKAKSIGVWIYNSYGNAVYTVKFVNDKIVRIEFSRRQ